MRKLTMFKAYLGLLILSIIQFVAIAFLAEFGFDYKLVIGSFIYFTTTFLCLKYIRDIKPIVLLQLITFPVLLILLFFNFADFNSTWVSTPSNIFLLSSSYASYFFYKSKNYLVPISFCLIATIWLVKGESVLRNFMQFGSSNGLVKEKISIINMFDITGKPANPVNTSKTVILDFWNSHCVPCFAQFPFIDSISKKIDTSKFELVVVNVPLNGENKEDNYKLLAHFNYSFKQLFAINSNIMDSFKIQYFPTTLVVKQNNIVFRGDFLDALNYLKIK